MKRNQKGFTLMEMLIVVAIIAVLVAVAIPVYTAQMHKARVAADMANVRAYYAQIQADYMLTGEKNPKVPIAGTLNGTVNPENFVRITFLDGATVKLQAGVYYVDFDNKDGDECRGYTVAYHCLLPHDDHTLILGYEENKTP